VKKLFIGCGGWSYWQVDKPYQSSSDRLTDYATVFNFVEVNNTFYQRPPLKEVVGWRRKVPKEFQFAVKCSRQITHQNPLVSIESNFQMMDTMLEICKTLHAVALVFQTPPTFRPTSQNLQFADTFFAHYDNAPVEFVWEPRGKEWSDPKVKTHLKQILIKHNITHCVDISQSLPIYSANISYTRVFGLGVKNQWEFDNEEIQQLHQRAVELPGTTYVTFHTQRQAHDAARMKAFDETGRLINPTGKFDLDSMMVAINEYRKYPVTKQELLMAHGWKVIDLSKKKRVRAKMILTQLPNTQFNNQQDLRRALEKIFRKGRQKKLGEIL